MGSYSRCDAGWHADERHTNVARRALQVVRAHRESAGMTSLLLRPLPLFVFCFLGFWLAAWLGTHLRQGWAFNEERRADFNVIQAATLTLLGLLIGFSFSMAISRYDQRKNLEEAEANAIGTEYLRADLLVSADREKVRELLKKYVDLRVRFYGAEPNEVGPINTETGRLQSDLWSAVVGHARQQPDPVVALTVAGMNDVINAQGYTQAAWWNHIPISAAILVAVIGLLCNAMIGYGSRSMAPRNPLLMVLPLFVAIAFALIVDIDTPRLGLIRVTPLNLLSLLDSMKAQ
jgi:hypothetical protein